MMKIYDVPVISRDQIAEDIVALSFDSKDLAEEVRPGQFLNIRVGEGLQPLLRRPFSVSRIEGSTLEILFNVVGTGTRALASKRIGDTLNVLGPLGVPFGIEGDFETAIIVAGGLGVAPFPLLTATVSRNRRVETFVGARTSAQVIERFLVNVHVATDDGSKGHGGTVVDLLERYLQDHPQPKPKIFACGPTPMLKALTGYAVRSDLACELSLEGDMACGVGICQGCPVERVRGKKKYSLVCTEGPTFDCREVVLP